MRYIEFIQKGYRPRLTDAICEFYVEREENSLMTYHFLMIDRSI